jgi:hypothetical protein
MAEKEPRCVLTKFKDLDQVPENAMYVGMSKEEARRPRS